MKYILSIFFIVSLSQLLAQSPVAIHLSEKEGLPDIEFYGAVEDDKGFIWFAANKGLYRYDGREFKNYTHPKKKGLSVFGLKFDKQGRLWCNNISGQYFYVENDSLKLFKDLKKYNKSGQLGDFLFFKNKLVVTCIDKIIAIDLISKSDMLLLSDKSKFRQIVAYVKKDSLYAITDKYLYKQTKNKKLTKIQSLKLNTTANSKLQMLSSKGGNVLVLKQNLQDNLEDKLYYNNGREIKEIDKKSEDFDAVAINEIDNMLWVCSNKGVFVYEYIKGEFILKKQFFKNEFITGVLKDSNDNYWFTTYQNGIYVITNIEVETYKTNFKRNAITAVAKIDTTTVLIGGLNGGLAKVNIDTKKIEDISVVTNQKIEKIVNLKGSQFISLSRTGALLRENNEIELLPNFGNAKGLSKIDDENIIFGGYASARIFNLPSLEKKILCDKRTYATHFNKKSNKIFISYIDELVSYDLASLKSSSMFFEKKPIFGLDITSTNDGITWVATFKDGVLGVKEGKVIANYTKNNGLLSNQITLVKGVGNVLWIVTDKGIQKFNTVTKQFRNLTNQDGIPTFNISSLEVVENKVVLGSNLGLFVFKENDVFKKNNPIKFSINKVLIDDVEVPFENEYELDYNKSKIQFNFYTNGFLVDENIRYRYRINKRKWEVLDKNVNQVTFNNLASGSYSLDLESIPNNTDEVAHSKTVFIYVNPPFYKQSWFIALLGILGGSILLIYIKKTKKRQKAQLEKVHVQKQLASLRLTSLQAQLNPHFVFNALSSIQNLVLKDEKMKAYNYLTKFASLMRDTLRMSDKNFVYLHEELHQIIKYLELERLRFRNDFEFYIEDYSAIADVKIPTMLIQPFVENAIKHGLLHKKEGLKKIDISFKIEESILICYIEDNGIGRIKAAQLKQEQDNTISFSTNAIKNRLKLLEKHYKNVGFTYESVKIGTKVAIRLPFK